MYIDTKHKSADLIKSLDLNRVEQEIFYAGEEEKVKDYIDCTQYALYNIRDRLNSGGVFKQQIAPHKVLQEIKEYKCFCLFESLKTADENHLILQGDIGIDSNMNVFASLSDVKGITLRDATNYPKYNLKFDLLEDKEPRIRGLKRIIDFIFRHELFNCVIEFSLFDVPVGIKHDNLLIWEIRNY